MDWREGGCRGEVGEENDIEAEGENVKVGEETKGFLGGWGRPRVRVQVQVGGGGNLVF